MAIEQVSQVAAPPNNQQKVANSVQMGLEWPLVEAWSGLDCCVAIVIFHVRWRWSGARLVSVIRTAGRRTFCAGAKLGRRLLIQQRRDGGAPRVGEVHHPPVLRLNHAHPPRP